MTRACVSVASPGSFSCGSMERGKQGREDLLTAWRKKKRGKPARKNTAVNNVSGVMCRPICSVTSVMSSSPRVPSVADETSPDGNGASPESFPSVFVQGK